MGRSPTAQLAVSPFLSHSNVGKKLSGIHFTEDRTGSFRDLAYTLEAITTACEKRLRRTKTRCTRPPDGTQTAMVEAPMLKHLLGLRARPGVLDCSTMYSIEVQVF